jgi:hypothetical protein
MVMDKAKLRLGIWLRTETFDGRFARFSTSIPHTDAYYTVLAYSPVDGFILSFPLTPIVPGDQWSTDVRLKIEDIIFEATSKRVPFRVVASYPQ